MLYFIQILITSIIGSFFYFPFCFTVLPTVNTKMMMAFAGLVVLFVKMATIHRGFVNRDFFRISLFALGVSFVSYLTMVYNNTTDDSYLSYVISMWVWCGAAYFFVTVIQAVHGSASVELICKYLIAVGVAQCLIAVAIDMIPFVKAVVYSFLDGFGYMGKTAGRMHGIGCALDVGGGRLAVILLFIAFLLPSSLARNQKKEACLLAFSFCLIVIVGNMIGRTTIVGALLSLVYWLYLVGFDSKTLNGHKKLFVNGIVLFVFIGMLLSVFLYNLSPKWEKQFRFGFEGFFSLVEKGRWEVQSNEMLQEGFIFPDNEKTWIIGDGYMADPDLDPYYQGEASWGFYKNTDAGYSRFIFYFGLIGLSVFILFLFNVFLVCANRFSNYRLLFLGILCLNLLIWIKVSTDIFLAFAPFLCLTQKDDDEDLTLVTDVERD